jgi:pimeloyl-ACP methyl ester carboxylesterase
MAPASEDEMPETLVLVPGLNCTPALFAAQIAALGSDCDILLADNSRDETMAGIARRLLAAAQGRFALAGLSMGGYIALEAMHQAPERVTRLALLDTNAVADGPERREARAKQIALAGEGRFREVVDEMWPRMVHPDRLSDQELRRIYDQMAEETGPEAFVRQLRSIMGRRDSRPMLPSIRVPTLVLVGDEDRLTPPEQSREMAALIPGARLVVVPGSGHLSTLERPDEVGAALRDWLAA